MEKELRVASFQTNLEGRITGLNWEEEREDEEFYIFLPYSNLRTWVYTGDELYKASQVFPTWRLSDIRQLSLLSWTGPEPDKHVFMEFPHTRFEHTLVVAKVMEKILQSNGIGKEEVDKGITAAILHDIATPVGGDPIKAIDPKNLDEEEFWWEVVDSEGWDFLAKRGIKKEELGEIIKNKGYLGEVLDIADRIHYVMKDLSQVVGEPKYRIRSPFDLTQYPLIDQAYGRLKKVVEKEPFLGDIYKDVKIDPAGNIYFTDHSRLAKFLEARALMHKYLYSNPISQGKDIRLGNLVSQFYSSDENDKDKLTPSRLRRMRDGELFEYLVKGTRKPGLDASFLYRIFVGWRSDSMFEKFDSSEEAKKRAQEIKDTPNFQFVGMREWKGFDPGTTYKVLDGKRNIVPFRVLHPKIASKIEEVSKSTKGVYVFYLTSNISDLDYDMKM